MPLEWSRFLDSGERLVQAILLRRLHSVLISLGVRYSVTHVEAFRMGSARTSIISKDSALTQ